jgi:hypothetical protein
MRNNPAEIISPCRTGEFLDGTPEVSHSLVYVAVENVDGPKYLTTVREQRRLRRTFLVDVLR